MDNRILTTLSVITSFHNRNKSVLDAFIPLVEFGIATLEADKAAGHYDIGTLQKTIIDETGVKINTASLTSILKKFERNNIIVLMGGGAYFRINADKRADQRLYCEAVNQHRRGTNDFILKYKEYSGDTRNEDQLVSWIYEFVQDYCKYIVVQNGDVRISAQDFMQYKQFVDFLKHINQRDNAATQTFIDIYYGFSLCGILDNNSTEIQNAKINDTTIYLDSNFILRLMDLQEEHACIETRELFQMLRENKAKLRIFNETVEEIKRVINYYYDYYRANDQVCKAMFDTPEYISGVLGAFYRRNLTFSQIDDIIDGIDSQIESFGLSIDYLSRYRTNIKEADVDKLYETKYSKLADTERSEYRENKCRNYLSIMQVIQYRRNMEKAIASCLGNSKFIFLTCDKKLCQFAHTKDENKKYPLVVNQELLANDMMLFDPQNFSSIAVKLMVSIYQESQYLNVHIIDDLSKTIVEVSKENPSTADFIIRATRNSRNFEDINEVFKDPSGDNKDKLIVLSNEIREEEETQALQNKQLSQDNAQQQQTIKNQEDEIRALRDELNQIKIDRLAQEESRKKEAVENFIKDFNHYIKKLRTLAAIFRILFTAVLLATGTLTLFWNKIPESSQIVLAIAQYVLGICSSITIAFDLKTRWFKRKAAKERNHLMTYYKITMEDVTNFGKSDVDSAIKNLLQD